MLAQPPAQRRAARSRPPPSARGGIRQRRRVGRPLGHGVQDEFHLLAEADGGAVGAGADVQRGALLQRPHLAVRQVAHQRRDLCAREPKNADQQSAPSAEADVEGKALSGAG